MRKQNLGLMAMAFGFFTGIAALGQHAATSPSPLPAIEGPPPVTAELSPVLPPPTPQLVTGAPTDDPVQAVQAFLAKNRKEAEEAIDRLTKEAETLRARLEQVEAALVRWKALEGALQQQPAKTGVPLEPVRGAWRRTSPLPPPTEVTPQLEPVPVAGPPPTEVTPQVEAVPGRVVVPRGSP